MRRESALPLATLLILVGLTASAQEPSAPPPVPAPTPRPAFTGDRVINQPTNRTIGAGTLQVVFTHRFSQTVEDASGYELFGLDSAADIGLGLELGLGRDLEVGLLRSSFQKTFEGHVKWTAVHQGEAFPIGLGVRMGADYRAADGVDERWSGFAQLVIGRRFGENLDLFLIPSFASDTTTLENAANVAFAGILYLPRAWYLSFEAVPENQDARNGEVAWAIGIAKRVPGHDFLIYFGNSPATTVDLLVGSDLPGGFDASDVRLGFNLLRRFPE